MSQNQDQFRRKYPRRSFARGIGILYRGGYFLSEGDEIGEGGVSFVLDNELEVGAELVVNLKIPGGDFVNLRAEVKSARPSAKGGTIHGVAFANIAFTHKRQIRNFVSERKSA